VIQNLLRDSGFARLYVPLAPLYLAPLVATTFLPAFDLPHHLSVVDALTKANDPHSPYARDFIVGLEVAPFAVHFVVLRALAQIMSVGIAAKVLVGAVILALPLVTARLLAVLGRDTTPALLALPLAYSMPLHFGLIAYVVALPFLVWMVAEGSNENGWREHPLQTAVVFGALSLMTFFAHLEAWAFGVVAAFVAILLSSVSWRSRVLALASVVPSLMLCGFFMFRTAINPQFRDEPSFVGALVGSRLYELGERGIVFDVLSRIRGLPIHLLRGFNDGSDVVAARVFFALIAVAMAIGLVSWARRVPRVLPRPSAASGLIAVGLLAYVGLPHHIVHAHSIYPRFAVVLALLLLLTIPSWFSAKKAGVAACVAVLLAVHGVDVVRHYAAFGRELADFEQAVKASPAGRRSGGLVFAAESTVMNVGGIFTGIPVYYVTERKAPRSSTWLYYCVDPQFPCRMRDPNRVPPVPHFTYPEQFNSARWAEDLDLLFVRGGPPAEKIFGNESSRVRLIAESGLWRVFARQ